MEGSGIFMVPATAIGLLLGAYALLFGRSPSTYGAAVKIISRLAAAATMALGLVVIVQYATDAGTVRDPLFGSGGWWAQRPSPITALGLVFIGASLIALSAQHIQRWWVSFSATATLVVALIGLVGYAYGASQIYGVHPWGGTAVSTAVALFALSLGVLFADPSHGMAAILVSESAAGRLLRRLLPWTVVAPLLLGGLALAAQAYGLVDVTFGTALLVVPLIILLAGHVILHGNLLNALEAEKVRFFEREQKAREQVANILESVTDAFFAVDRGWRFVYVNRESERLLRRTREELLGRSLWDEFPAAVGATFQQEYLRAMTMQETIQFEEHYEPLGIWVDVRAYPTTDGLSVYFRDVTERKLAGERIRESEARFRAFAENATVAIFVIDEESIIEFVNPAVERIFGYALPELLGRSLDVLIPKNQRPLHNNGIRRYRETGQRSINWEGIELPGLTKEGRIIPLEISLGEFERDGRRYFTGIARDISERKQAEKALQESEERYRLLADMIPQHIWTTEADGYHTYFSRRWYDYTGATQDQTQGVGWLALLHPADRQHSLRTGEPYTVEYRIRREDGIYGWFLGQAMPLRNETGAIIRWFGTLTDISEQKRHDGERERLFKQEQEARTDAERRRAELERVTESRARLMRGFSHDLRNPLGVADMQAWMLQDGLFGDLVGKQRESVQSIRRSIATSLRLIDDLMELARAEAGLIELRPVETDVGQLAREIAEDFRAPATAVGLTLDIRAPDGLKARTDPVRARQILANLLSNAVKYAPKGQVTVDAAIRQADRARPGTWIVVCVADTGPGIPEDKREQIFQEFARLDPNAQHGAGVGLAISRRIARLMGGDLNAQSEPGRGSTFILWLPSSAAVDE